jgi:hypothetical protein
VVDVVTVVVVVLVEIAALVSDEVVVELVLLFEIAAMIELTVVAEEVVVELVLTAVDVDEVEDVLEAVCGVGEYTKVTTCDAVAPLPPQVAFTENVPPVFGKTSLMSATLPAGFVTVTMIPVFGPGAGETTPVISIGSAPEYDDASVSSVIVYVVVAANAREKP